MTPSEPHVVLHKKRAPSLSFQLFVELLSHVQLFANPWTATHQTSLSITIHWNFLRLMSIEPVMPSNHLICWHPFLLLLSILPIIRVFFNELSLHIKWPKDQSCSFCISPSNEYSGLISFRMDQFDLLAVQGTLKSLLQHHSLKALILQHSAFFMVQLSHPYMITGKTMALTIGTFVGKVKSLLFNICAVQVCHSFSSKKQVSFNFMGASQVALVVKQTNKQTKARLPMQET